jgi:hypothetical protein
MALPGADPLCARQPDGQVTRRHAIACLMRHSAICRYHGLVGFALALSFTHHHDLDLCSARDGGHEQLLDALRTWQPT